MNQEGCWVGLEQPAEICISPSSFIGVTWSRPAVGLEGSAFFMPRPRNHQVLWCCHWVSWQTQAMIPKGHWGTGETKENWERESGDWVKEEGESKWKTIWEFKPLPSSTLPHSGFQSFNQEKSSKTVFWLINYNTFRWWCLFFGLGDNFFGIFLHSFFGHWKNKMSDVNNQHDFGKLGSLLRYF